MSTNKHAEQEYIRQTKWAFNVRLTIVLAGAATGLFILALPILSGRSLGGFVTALGGMTTLRMSFSHCMHLSAEANKHLLSPNSAPLESNESNTDY